MKKLFLIVLGLSICLFLAGYSISDTNAQTIDNSNTDQTINDTKSSPPADVMYFDSFQHMAQLKMYIEKVDDPKSLEYDEYIYKNYRGGFRYPGFVSQMFDNLDGLNMLILDSSSGYNLSSLEYYGSGYAENGKMEYVYANQDKKIRIHCYVDPNGTEASKVADILQGWNVADKIDLGDEEIVLYYPSGESKIAFRCCVNTSNSLIDVWFYDDDKTAVKEVIEKYAISTTLNELLEQEKLQTFVKIASCGLITSFMLLLSMISCFKKSRNDINEKHRLKKATFIMSILSFVIFGILVFMRFSIHRDFVFWIFLIWYLCLNISIALYVISTINKVRKRT